MKVLERPEELFTASAQPEPSSSLVVGELLALSGDGSVPLVLLPGAPKAVAARSTLDLHGAHIGGHVVVAFEEGDRDRPIVMGVLRRVGWPGEDEAPHVEIESDGERFVMTATRELVLRCGKASITLTKAGKVLIEGTYVSSRSSGVNRLKGGSVQLN